MAVEMLAEAFTNLPAGGDAEELMKISIERANGAIYQMSHDLPQLSTMATTIVALHIDGNIATIGHVGDSRLYRLDAGGNLFRETEDHSLVEEEMRAGRMTADQAANHPNKNIISRALGAEPGVEVDMKTIMFEPHTTFLLCSDGITRHIEDGEIRELLQSSKPLAQICEGMKNICYGRGAEDNLTAVIARVAETGVAVAAGETQIDFEENTVAAARQPLVATTFDNLTSSTTAGSAPITISEEIPTQNLQMPAPAPSQIENQADPARQNSVSANDSSEISQTEIIEQTVPAISETPAVIQTDERNLNVIEDTGRRGSGFGKFLSTLALILISAGLGAAAYHFWRQSQLSPVVVQEAPKITQMQTPNSAYSAFEDNRRNADRNPAQFIEANGNAAADAEDFYLLGRANLQLGKYTEAKEALTKARELLPQMNGADKLTLTSEINFGLSIVDSDFSRRFLDLERNKANAAQNQAGNANVTPDTEIKPLTNQAVANQTLANSSFSNQTPASRANVNK
jgi:serine/threonine protein phosphatase PrpC